MSRARCSRYVQDSQDWLTGRKAPRYLTCRDVWKLGNLLTESTAAVLIATQPVQSIFPGAVSEFGGMKWRAVKATTVTGRTAML